MMTIQVPAVCVPKTVHRPILSGRLAGDADRPKLDAAVQRAMTNGLVLIDLEGTEFLSSSYFDAAIWPLWAVTNEDFYPVLANVPAAAADDIAIVLQAHSAAIWSVTPRKKAPFSGARLLGTLDPPLEKIIALVQATGETTAADLASDRANEPIGATAWSNRLALLHKLRLLRRRKDGRRLIYGLPWGK